MHKVGLTLLEVLVVCALVALLVALVLPAIQFSRTAAARADCQNRLRQLAVALNGYSIDNDCFPPVGFAARGVGATGVGPWCGQVALLPYLDQRELYNSLNLGLFWAAPDNRTAGAISPGVFLCPADAAPQSTHQYGFGNYAACVGSGIWPRGLDAEVSGVGFYDGIFFGKRGVTPAQCTDGLSNTAAFSERVHGAAYDGLKLRELTRLPVPTVGIEYTFPSVSPHTQTRLIEICEGIGPDHGKVSFNPVGKPWFLNGSLNYNHLLTPNRPTCIGTRYGNFFCPLTASSRHSQLVNVAFGEGHAAAITERVDLTTWRALGSRNGGETVPAF